MQHLQALSFFFSRLFSASWEMALCTAKGLGWVLGTYVQEGSDAPKPQSPINS